QQGHGVPGHGVSRRRDARETTRTWCASSRRRSDDCHPDRQRANIFLTKNGAKLLDFGLAKAGAPALAGAGVSVQPTTPPGLTPPPVDRVVVSCLAKDPDDRWQSARDMVRELTWIAEHQATIEALTSASSTPRKRLAWIIAGVVAGLILGASVALFVVRSFMD